MTRLFETGNSWDESDMIRMVHSVLAAGMRFAQYRIRDAATLEWSKSQFHMTWQNKVIAVLSEDATDFAKEVYEHRGADYVNIIQSDYVKGSSDDHTFETFSRGNTRIVFVKTRRDEIKEGESPFWPESAYVYEHGELRGKFGDGTYKLFCSMAKSPLKNKISVDN